MTRILDFAFAPRKFIFHDGVFCYIRNLKWVYQCDQRFLGVLNIILKSYFFFMQEKKIYIFKSDLKKCIKTSFYIYNIHQFSGNLFLGILGSIEESGVAVKGLKNIRVFYLAITRTRKTRECVFRAVTTNANHSSDTPNTCAHVNTVWWVAKEASHSSNFAPVYFISISDNESRSCTSQGSRRSARNARHRCTRYIHYRDGNLATIIVRVSFRRPNTCVNVSTYTRASLNVSLHCEQTVSSRRRDEKEIRWDPLVTALELLLVYLERSVL